MAVIDVGDLGDRGVRFDGLAPGDLLGLGYGAGGPIDFNGDGIPDLILPAQGTNGFEGAVYVVFGTAGTFPSDLGALGQGGFTIVGTGPAGGLAVTAGDINGDGIADLIVGEPNADPVGTGAAHVIFGSQTIGSGGGIDLGSLGNAGFSILGSGQLEFAGSGAVALGDLDGDGVDDVLVGLPGNNGGGAGSGAAVVVRGSSDPLPATVLPGEAGISDYLIFGAEGDRIGNDFAVGDFNADGVPDIVAAGDFAAKTFHVLPGRDEFAPGEVTLGGADSFTFTTPAASGIRLAAGDFDGDGMDDIAVGLPNLPNGGNNRGGIFIIPNGAALADNTLQAASAVSAMGTADDQQLGIGLANAGDVNGDGIDDLLIGSNANRGYVLFGGPGMPADLGDLDDLGDAQGIVVQGAGADDKLGYTVSAPGDVNGDGLADVLFGAPDAMSLSGAFFLIFGDLNVSSTSGDDSLTSGIAGDAIDGGEGADTLTGGGGADTLTGGPGDDLLIGARVGEAGDDAADVIDGGEGADRGYGQAGDDSLAGGADNDSLFGNAGNDSLSGDGGDDLLRGHFGADMLAGGADADELFGGADDDTVDGGDGDDTLSGNSGADSLAGGAGDDLVRGQGNADELYGGDGNDTLRGMQGSDALFGGNGSDMLTGGNGSDSLTGGPGDDIFQFAAGQGDDLVMDLDVTADLLSFVGLTFEELAVVDTADGALITIAAEGDNPTVSVRTMGVFADDISASLFLG